MVVAVTVIFVRIIDKKSITVVISKHWLRDTVMGVATGAMWIGVALLTLKLMGILTIGGKAAVPFLVVFVVALLLNAVTQELLVRGYLFSYLARKHGTLAAIVPTTLLFTLLHGGAFGAGIIAVLNVVTASVFLSLMLLYTDGLWATILVHFVWNLIGGLIFGLVSLGDSVSVFHGLLTGGSLLAGGGAKVEGSIVVMVLNIVLCVIVYWLMRKRLSVASE
jgi:membrane protease YdiL (CAAX protease family)